MTKLIATILLSLWTIQVTTQGDFEAKIESFIEPILSNYKLIVSEAEIENYAASGATWSKRIDLKSKNLFRNKYDQQDYQEYTFTFIYFENSDSCEHARKKYLDHFSFDGKLTSETKGVKRPPSFNLINENSIIIFEVSCEGHQMDDKWSWNKIKENLILKFGSKDSEIIENSCGGPITWINNKNK